MKINTVFGLGVAGLPLGSVEQRCADVRVVPRNRSEQRRSEPLVLCLLTLASLAASLGSLTPAA